MENKTCNRCKIEKPPEEFYRKTCCKQCHNDRIRAVKAKRRELGLCYCGNETVPGSKRCARCKAYYFKYISTPGWTERTRTQMSITRRKLRDVALEKYGAICKCCGESTWQFLTIDHIDPVGIRIYISGNKRDSKRDPARKQSHRGGTQLYRWLRDNGWPDGFRVLCMNCNFSLGHYGFCPHGGLSDVQNVQ